MQSEIHWLQWRYYQIALLMDIIIIIIIAIKQNRKLHHNRFLIIIVGLMFHENISKNNWCLH